VKLCILFALLTQSPKVQVVLTDNSVLTGSIVSQTEDSLVLETQIGKISLVMDDIKEIRYTANKKLVEVELSDGSVLRGELLYQDSVSVKIKTKFGEMSIPRKTIVRMQFLENEKMLEKEGTGYIMKDENVSIGKALLYQQRKKSVLTALGFQTSGAGLLYTEKYTLGTIMLLLENGLIIGSLFAGNDEDTQLGLLLSGLLLKSLNTIFTIHAVNSYNNRLAEEMGLKPKIPKTPKKPRKLKFYLSFGVSPLVSCKFLIPPTLRFGLAKEKWRLVLNGFIGSGKYQMYSLDKTSLQEHTMTYAEPSFDVSLQYIRKIRKNFYIKLGTGISGLVTKTIYESEYYYVEDYSTESGISFIGGLGWEQPLNKKATIALNTGTDNYITFVTEGDMGPGFHIIPNISLVFFF